MAASRNTQPLTRPATQAPGPQDRRVLSTAGVPQADRYGLPSTRPWWLTPGVVIAAVVCLTALTLAAWGGVIFLARADRLDELQAFLARLDETKIGAAVLTFLGAVVIYLRANAGAVFARRAAEAAGNAEAHAGRVLPQRLEHLEEVVTAAPALTQPEPTVAPATAPAEAAGLPAPAPAAPEPPQPAEPLRTPPPAADPLAAPARHAPFAWGTGVQQAVPQQAPAEDFPWEPYPTR